jgi:ribosomal protein L7/L12
MEGIVAMEERSGRVWAAASETWSRDRDIEALLAYLRNSGFSKLSSIRAVMEITGATLAEAKKIVHLSRAWSDRREQDDEFHEKLECAAEEVAAEMNRPAARSGEIDRGRA